MTDEEIAVKLEGHDHEIGSLKHRMAELEEQSKVIQDLVLSVKELALNMQAMIKEQGAQGERLAKLEAEPAEQCEKNHNEYRDWSVSRGSRHRPSLCHAPDGQMRKRGILWNYHLSQNITSPLF